MTLKKSLPFFIHNLYKMILIFNFRVFPIIYIVTVHAVNRFCFCFFLFLRFILHIALSLLKKTKKKYSARRVAMYDFLLMVSVLLSLDSAQFLVGHKLHL